jgi:secreted PhoX family phosphatase
VTRRGEIFDFALNAIPQRMAEEFAGATFSSDGKVLFVNIQASQGTTFAIWGPWRRGAL